MTVIQAFPAQPFALKPMALGSDLRLFEITEAAQHVSNLVAPEANIIIGALIDDALGDEVRVTVIATGLTEVDNASAYRANQ